MGIFIDGIWHGNETWADEDGEFRRKASSFRARLDEDPRFPAARGRYRLYVSLACPWAHRTLVVRALKGLEDAVDVAVVNPDMLDDGWTFTPAPGVVPDPEGAPLLRDLYLRAKPDYTGRVTVPVLWDRETRTIVSNESSEILRDLNGPMSRFSSTPEAARLDLYPAPRRAEIDNVNARVYERVNNGVYRAGFATTQDAYERAFDALFTELAALERRLDGHEWLVGDTLTEADLRLFTTLVRFDAVYFTHFKCNLRRLVDMPNLHAHTLRVLALPGVRATVDMAHIKRHYFFSHRKLNPSGIVPKGPALAW